jgi:hypothetical protein
MIMIMWLPKTKQFLNVEVYVNFLKRKTEFAWKPKKSDLLVYSEKTINELNKLYSE